MTIPTTFLYGTAAYRPTSPPPEDFRKHFTCIKRQLGFDIVRLRVEWNPINRERDTFDFMALDQILDLCDELGLLAFLETNLQMAPYWIEAVHPEARYVNALGQAAELGPNEAMQIGGYPGLCHHHEAVTRAGGLLVAEARTGHYDHRNHRIARGLYARGRHLHGGAASRGWEAVEHGDCAAGGEGPAAGQVVALIRIETDSGHEGLGKAQRARPEPSSPSSPRWRR